MIHTSSVWLLNVLLIGSVLAGLPAASNADGGGHETLAFAAPLPNVPGKALTAVVLSYAPAGALMNGLIGHLERALLRSRRANCITISYAGPFDCFTMFGRRKRPLDGPRRISAS